MRLRESCGNRANSSSEFCSAELRSCPPVGRAGARKPKLVPSRFCFFLSSFLRTVTLEGEIVRADQSFNRMSSVMVGNEPSPPEHPSFCRSTSECLQQQQRSTFSWNKCRKKIFPEKKGVITPDMDIYRLYAPPRNELPKLQTDHACESAAGVARLLRPARRSFETSHMRETASLFSRN